MHHTDAHVDDYELLKRSFAGVYDLYTTVYDRILAVHLDRYYDRMSPCPYTEQNGDRKRHGDSQS